MRIFFILLIAFGAAMYFPRSRAVIVDLVAPVMDPLLAWSTRSEMQRIVDDLQTQSRTGRNFPIEQEEFVIWMNNNFQGVSSRTDPWGNTYTLRLRRDSFGVVSSGPDGELGTEDDVRVEGRLQSDVRRRR